LTNADIPSHGFLNEDWEYLFYYIDHKTATPFLGAGISRDRIGSGKELSEILAKEFDYPFDDTSNLAKVAQFAVIKKKDNFRVRKFVADYIKNKELPDFSNPSEPHNILAKLDLPIYITTNYDHLMYEALKSDGKEPIMEFCRWNDLAQLISKPSIFTEEKINTFDTNNPLVYHLHGEIDNPQSMVLTEDDYLNFLVRLYLDIDKLFPPEIKIALVSTAIIFIGYSLSDWNLRIVLRTITESMKSASMTNCSIQLTPTGIKIKDMDEIRKYLQKYLEIIQGGKTELKIFWGTATEFCTALSQRHKIRA
jgi:SIR2-like domain